MYNNQSSKYSLRGQVRTKEKHKGIPNAALSIVGDSPAHYDIAYITNNNGEYNIRGLSRGQYTIQVNAEGYPPKRKHIVVKDIQAEQVLDFFL